MNGERSEEMTVFVRAVELGGFSAAARALGLTPSAVSKSISRLEDRLGVRLLNRTTRSLTTTPEGETFLERSRRILADIDEAEQEITRFRSAPRGLLRLHVSVAFGLHQLPPALPSTHDEFYYSSHWEYRLPLNSNYAKRPGGRGNQGNFINFKVFPSLKTQNLFQRCNQR